MALLDGLYNRPGLTRILADGAQDASATPKHLERRPVVDLLHGETRYGRIDRVEIHVKVHVILCPIVAVVHLRDGCARSQNTLNNLAYRRGRRVCRRRRG